MDRHLRLKPVTIAFIVVVAIVFFFAGHSVGTQQLALAQSSPMPTGIRDGDPVGFDLFRSSPVTMFSLGAGRCVNSSGCKSVEVHYLDTPPVNCPKLKNLLSCTAGSPRTLPTCPRTGAQCLLFKNMAATVEAQDGHYGTNVWHGPYKATAQVLVILR
jgi:hypothetical protein